MNAPVQASEDLPLLRRKTASPGVTFNRPQARKRVDLCNVRADGIDLRDRKQRPLDQSHDPDWHPATRRSRLATDISQFRAFKSAEDALEYEARIDRVLGALETCRVPTIAAIAGACTGGGAGIAACCDIRIGTAATRIGFPIARTLGNCLSMSNISRLVSLIGPARTKDLIFKARLVEAP